MSKPVKSFKLGPVEAAIFANEGDQGSFHTVTVQRRYKDTDGSWKSSNSFTQLQLPYLIAVAQEALHFLANQSNREEGGDTVDPDACYFEMYTAMRDGDPKTARDRAQALQEWLRKGGFYPRNYSRQKVDAYLANVLRHTTGLKEAD